MKVELWPAGDTLGITQVAGGTCDGRKVAPETSSGSPASSPYLVEHPSGATDGCLGSADGRLGATDRRWWAFQPALGRYSTTSLSAAAPLRMAAGEVEGG